MSQIKSISPVSNLPEVGYVVSKDERREKLYKNETHIHEQNMFSGISADLHKFQDTVVTYFPKGFAGSKNSDFYEYLSLGTVPYLIGSAMLYATYGALKGVYNTGDGFASNKIARNVGAGVVLYGVGKWAYQRLARAGIYASTGVNLDMRYIKKINELPEVGQEKGLVRKQFPGVYDSVQFYRSDKLAEDAELNHDDLYYYDDIIVKKAGYDQKLYAPNQTASDKIRKLKARTTALENIGKYVIAATGVAYGAQKAFESASLKNPKSIINALKTGLKQLWDGTNRNAITKHYGKALLIGSAITTLLTWLIPVIEFKRKPDTIKTKIDTNKEYEVC